MKAYLFTDMIEWFFEISNVNFLYFHVCNCNKYNPLGEKQRERKAY